MCVHIQYLFYPFIFSWTLWLLLYLVSWSDMLLTCLCHSLSGFSVFDMVRCCSFTFCALAQGLKPRGCGLVLLCGLLETWPHGRRWVAHKQGELYLCLQPLQIAPLTTRAPPPVRSVAALDAYRSTINLMCVIIPKPSPPPACSVEKLSSTKPVPGAKKIWDHCFRPGIIHFFKVVSPQTHVLKP